MITHTDSDELDNELFKFWGFAAPHHNPQIHQIQIQKPTAHSHSDILEFRNWMIVFCRLYFELFHI